MVSQPLGNGTDIATILNIFLSQVTLKLGEETWTCPVPDLQLVPYLAVQAARWNTSGVINLNRRVPG